MACKARHNLGGDLGARSPRKITPSKTASDAYLSKTPVWQGQSSQSRCSRIIVWNILSCFFMYVSVSNLHFPQMNLVSEKPGFDAAFPLRRLFGKSALCQ